MKWGKKGGGLYTSPAPLSACKALPLHLMLSTPSSLNHWELAATLPHMHPENLFNSIAPCFQPPLATPHTMPVLWTPSPHPLELFPNRNVKLYYPTLCNNSLPFHFSLLCSHGLCSSISSCPPVPWPLFSPRLCQLPFLSSWHHCNTSLTSTLTHQALLIPQHPLYKNPCPGWVQTSGSVPELWVVEKISQTCHYT